MTVFEKFRRIELWVTLAVLTGVLLLIGWATITRYLGVPNIWVIEVTQALFAWVCFLCADMAFRKQSHFSVDFLSMLLPDRIKPYLGLVQNVIILVLLIALFYVSLDYVQLANRRHLPLSGIPFSWVVMAFPIACILMSITCIENIIGIIRPSPLPEENT